MLFGTDAKSLQQATYVGRIAGFQSPSAHLPGILVLICTFEQYIFTNVCRI